MQRSMLFLTLSLAALVSACASASKPVVLSAPEARQRLDSLTLREGEFEVSTVSEENRAKLRRALQSRLYKAGLFTEGPDLVLTYAVTEYDKGSRAARYWSSGTGGTGYITLDVNYSDATGRQLGRVRFPGKITGGVYGGDFSTAIGAVAEAVAGYTREHFHNPYAGEQYHK